MSATHDSNSTASCAPVLYLALDLGASSWKLAFSVGLGQKPRLKTIAARSTLSLIFEIRAAKGRFGLPEDAPVATRQGATASGCIAPCWTRGSGTRSSTPPASRSTAAAGGPSRIASTQ